MRPIRFKARALGSREMVEGYYVHQHIAIFDKDNNTILRYQEEDAIYNDEPGNRNDRYWTRIAPDTLCQQTGAEDMFFMPIWEHDSVRLHSRMRRADKDPYHEATGEVIFHQTCFLLLMDDGKTMSLKHARSRYELQVIGNRFENM